MFVNFVKDCLLYIYIVQAISDTDSLYQVSPPRLFGSMGLGDWLGVVGTISTLTLPLSNLFVANKYLAG